MSEGITWANERRRLGDLREWEDNPRLLMEHDANELDKSLAKFSLADPLIINLDNTLIGGHQRRRRLIEKHGLDYEVDVRVPSRMLTPAEMRELAIRLNRNQGKWDNDILADRFDFGELLDFGFTEKELGFFDPTEEGPDSLDDAPDELPGVKSLKHDAIFPSSDEWGIPDLLPDRLCSIPENIDTWAGWDVCHDEPDRHWLYNWGTDSIRGLPLERTLLAFYTDDVRFDKFWFETEKYVAKLINNNIVMSVSPNYSLWANSPRAEQLFNVYRSRWVARYMQEAGIAIIPDINWSDEKSFDFCLVGIPESAPAVAVQLQTLKTKNDFDRAVAGFARAIGALKPQSLLVYGHDAARRVIEQSGACADVRTVYVPNRADKRRKKLNSVVKEALR